MTNLGPPLTFKAVNTKTGEESKPFEIKLDAMIYILEKKWDEVDATKTFGFNNTQLCQSTGLHDSKGVEIFTGDVLWSVGKSYSMMEVVYKDGVFHVAKYNSNNDLFGWLREEIGDNTIVIGNRWTPLEELERRAEDA